MSESGNFESAKAAAKELLPHIDFSDPYVEQKFRELLDKHYRIEPGEVTNATKQIEADR